MFDDKFLSIVIDEHMLLNLNQQIEIDLRHGLR